MGFSFLGNTGEEDLAKSEGFEAVRGMKGEACALSRLVDVEGDIDGGDGWGAAASPNGDEKVDVETGGTVVAGRPNPTNCAEGKEMIGGKAGGGAGWVGAENVADGLNKLSAPLRVDIAPNGEVDDDGKETA